ncbi:MAG: ATP-grasp domain-containing protein [Spongiibacteraceae bacterium]|jgi:5-(carboxyamino)imidazole ribonucleotide synthase|nr:ATP-grasp domain-containing protein [Spongiibacteraceae bacterium]
MSSRLGIIGGGQLALYLCEAAKALDIEVTVVSETATAPALRYATHAVIGPLNEHGTLLRFLARCDTVTFDREDIPSDTLDYLANAEQQGHINVRPGVDTLRILKDKGLQKTWLAQQELPTLPFDILSGRPDSLSQLKARFGTAVVQKACRGGFDGRGVQILPDVALEQLWDTPSIIEPLLEDNQELAVIVTRSAAGEVQSFPPVSMTFTPELNSLSTVAMPASVSAELCHRATALGERVVTLLSGIGNFAIEMFLTPQGDLLINEISPRVHNSGHLTMDACNVSQFEQHVRAVMGMDLISPTMLSPGAMRNILYEESMRSRCPPLPRVERLPESASTIYWYGKQPGTRGRKMGHINALAATAYDAVERVKHALGTITHNKEERAE